MDLFRLHHKLGIISAICIILSPNADSAVTISDLPRAISVSETTTVTTVVTTVVPTGGTGPYQCSVGAGNSSTFSATGADITVVSALDYETTTQYVFVVECADALLVTGTGTLTVDVTDEFDELPVVTAANVSVDEEQAIGSLVHTILVTDIDASDSFTYSVTGIHSGYFYIETNGAIRNSQLLDFEGAIPVFTPIVIATDKGGNSGSATVSVTLKDTNDHVPTFDPSVYVVSVTENEPAGTSLLRVTYTDPDTDAAFTPVTHNFTGTGSSSFQFSGMDFETTATPLDYDTMSSVGYKYSFLVTATDGGGLTGTGTIIVQVLGANDNTPTWGTFIPTPPYSVDENVAIGTSIMRAVATDADDGADGVLTYSIVSITNGGGSSTPTVFHIDSTSGELSTNSLIDRDPNTGGTDLYDVTINVQDSGSLSPADIKVTINIGELNDNAPSFPQSLFLVSSVEGSTVDAVLQTFAATDDDITSTITYDIASGNLLSLFKIVGDELRINTVIDLDSPTSNPDRYTLVIQAKDQATGGLTGSVTVAIAVTTVNEHTPVLSSITPSAAVTVGENAVLGSTVAIVAFNDLDVGTDGQLSYAITVGNAEDNVQINPVTGEIQLVKRYDFETIATNPEVLTVTATDGGVPAKSATVDVTITVSNSNDNPPTCSPSSLSLSLVETTAVNTSVGTPSCSDADLDTLTYSFLTGISDFALDAASGAITVNNALDYDAGTRSYSLVIRVSDGAYIADVPVAILITPDNEATPTFTPAAVTVTFAEDTAVSTTLATHVAVDTDAETHGQLVYTVTTVTNSGTSHFWLDLNAGSLVLIKPLDYEALPGGSKFYTVTYTATDGGGLQGTGTVTVSVTDVNDNTPSCTPGTHSVSTPENAASLPIVLIPSLACTDPDDSPHGDLTYSLSQTPTGSHFSVSSGGVVSHVTAAVDYETSPSYTLTITVTDGGTPVALSTSVTVVVSVINVNDGGPSFSGTFSSTISEGAGVGALVADVVATDPDDPDTDEGALVYSIILGDVSNEFSMDADTGRVTLSKVLDRETIASYNLVIQAKEVANTISATVTLTVSVTDTNDVTPSCTVNTFAITKTEPGLANDNLMTFTCTDTDTAPFANLAFSITAGDTSVFKMNANALELKSPVDFDVSPRSYDLTVQVSDGTNSVDITGTVNVGATNEHAPIFTSSGVYNINIQENTSPGTLVVTVTTSDADSALTADGQVNYAFAGSYPNFQLSAATGAISIATSLDRDTTPLHTLLVTATDGTNSVTGTVSVTVGDINDNVPVFSPTTYSGVVGESDAAGASVVVTVTATDLDDPSTNDNGRIAYTITAGNIGNVFAVGSSNGQITTTSQLDYESATSYTLTLEAADKNGAGGGFTATCYVTVAVTNVNEDNPVFSPPSYNPNVPENVAVGSVIATVTATDTDAGDDGDVYFTTPVHTNFQLNSATGEITLKASLDFEVTSTFSLVITASDRGSPPKTATATVSVTVSDVNDNEPSCTPSIHTGSFAENTATSTTLATLTCSDTDSGANAALSYSIVTVNGVVTEAPFETMTDNNLRLGTTLDYETATTYTTVIKIQDGGVPILSTTSTVVIQVTDVNEAGPTYTSTPYSTNLAENAAVGSDVFTVSASDADTGQTVTFSLSAPSNEFSIDGTSGKITTKSLLDREVTPSYTLNVVATDSGVPPQSTTVPVAIAVTDINDNSPVFSPTSYSGVVSESDGAGASIIVTVAATDLDDPLTSDNGVIAYSITAGNTGNVFAVGSSNGQITTTSQLDYESATSYTLTVEAADKNGAGGGFTATCYVTVAVTNVNEDNPVFSPPSYNPNVPENVAVGSVIATVTATDTDVGDDGDVYFTTPVHANFQLNSATGEITLKASLDFEVTSTFSLVITASDRGSPPKTATATVSVTVSDVNDNEPSCTPSIHTGSFAENTATSTTLATLTCSDTDSGANAALSYSIVTVNGVVTEAPFETMTDNNLSLGTALDYETATTYTTVIKIQDGGVPILSTTSTVVIQVTDVNEAGPTYTSTPYSTNLAENAAVGSDVFTVSASDADTGQTVTFSLSAPSNEFSIDGTSGKITTKSLLDREVTPSYTLNVVATDSGVPPQSTTVPVAIAVTDINDNSPVFSPTAYSGVVSESDGAGASIIVTVAATDLDDPLTSDNGVIAYSITAGNTGNVFAVGSSNGQITTTSQLNYESATSYTLTVEAADKNGASGGFTATCYVTVAVTNVNEDNPVFSPPSYNPNVPENIAVGSVIATVTATDTDVGDDGDVYFTTPVHANFQLNSATGEITLKASLDFEVTSTFSLVITASDRGSPPKTATATVSVTVSDVNDNEPSCTPGIHTGSFAENTATSTTLATLTCSDTDSGANAALSYSIVTVNGVVTEAPFETMTDNNLSLGTALDYETATTYTTVLKIQDGGVPILSTTSTVVIQVTDVNEAGPTYTSTPYSTNLAENAAVGSDVFTVSASDADTGQTVTFSLSAPSNEFSIDGTSGKITTKSLLDREVTPSYTLNVVATDSGVPPQSTTVPVAITLTDINDYTPVFNPTIYNKAIAENSVTGVTIVTLTCSDLDSGSNGDVTYAILSGNSDNLFRVDKDVGTGNALVIMDDNTNLDYDAGTRIYALTVRASDGGGLTSNATVTMQVTPYNEHTPAFTPTSSSTQSLPESSSVGTTVSNLTVVDQDSGPGGDLTFSIASGSASTFSIDQITGSVTVAGLIDRESTTQFILTILCIDNGISPGQLTATYSLTVNIDDVNDNVPTCSRSLYTSSVPENIGTSTSVTSVSCSDDDNDPSSLNNAIVYTITGTMFTIDPVSGVVSTALTPFDRETTDSYTMTITATDRGVPSLSTTATLLISITDINDNAPVFTLTTYPASVDEDVTIDTFVIQVAVTDDDINSAGPPVFSVFSTVIYTILSGNIGSKFSIDANNGTIRTAAYLDRESVPSYTLIIQAIDQGVTPLSSSATVVISVNDINDSPPVCTTTVYTGSVNESASVSDNVVLISCSDADSPPNNIAVYSLLTASIPFSINPASGQIQVASSLDAETTSSYTLAVRASDGTFNTDVSAIISINDINEAPPSFTAGTGSVSFAENTALGTTISDVDAVDSDITDIVIFAITSGNTGTTFQIDASSGVIRLNSNLDFESLPNIFYLAVTATDDNGALSMTSTSTLTVSVTDINDNVPNCNPTSHSVTVDEDTTGSIVILSCSDADLADSLTYSIGSGNGLGHFTVNGATGDLAVATNLDYEIVSSYDLTITVSDDGSPTTMTTTVLVKITINPVNEYTPVFNPLIYNKTIPEDISVGSTVLTVTATDQDSGHQGEIRFYISSGDPQNHFGVDQSSGDLTTISSLDRETTASYDLRIIAVDSRVGVPGARTSTTTVSVTISDVNDNFPVFTPVTYTANVAETILTGATIKRLTASDADIGANGNLVYTIDSGDPGRVFNISGTDVTLVGTVDYDVQPLYQLVIKATDQGPSPFSSFASLTVALIPRNEFPPVFNASSPITLPENTAVGLPITTVRATDSDTGAHGEITYTIVSGNSPNSPFFLDANSGDVFVWSALDFDTPPQTYNLVITATDRIDDIGTIYTTTMTLSISLSDVNDEIPTFTQQTYNFNIDENSVNNSSVDSVVATDADSGINGQITFSVISGDGSTTFAVDANSGLITTIAPIDYEIKNFYSLVVKAEDGNAVPLSSQCLVIITINDMNDNTPTFTPGIFTVNILESAVPGTFLSTLLAVDADSSASNNNVLSYALSSPFFNINGLTGVVTVASALDRETTPVHTLIVRSIDGGLPALTGTATVTVTLDDVNDNDPVVSPSLSVVLSEDKVINSVIIDIVSTDADVGNNALLTHTIISGNTDSDFKIDPNSGIIQIRNTLDRERTSSYSLRVEVSDNSAPARTSTTVVTVTVTDINDNGPIFDTSPYNLSVAENLPPGTAVDSISATDSDSGYNASILYSIVSVLQGPNNHFAIDPSSGGISTTVILDRESVSRYVLWCRASDAGTPQLTTDVNVAITVTDINDNNPTFGSASYNEDVEESAAIGSSIFTLPVTDNDIGTNAAFTITIDTTSGDGLVADLDFQIDSVTGIVSVKRTLDKEIKDFYVFNVTAQDAGIPSLSSTTTVSITVGDINDNRPIFTQTYYDTEVAFNAECDPNFATVLATDLDSGQNAVIRYFQSASPTGALFNIDKYTGAVKIVNLADRDTKYVVNVHAVDLGSPSLTSLVDATIRVDTFDPDVVAVRLELSVSRQYLEAHQAMFLLSLSSIYRVKYARATVKLWCIEERAGEAIDPTRRRRRRRLLATGDLPAVANIIVMKDDSTSTVSGINSEKQMLAVEEALTFVQSDDTGTPASKLNGGSLSAFGVSKVLPYKALVVDDSSTSFVETTIGIIVVSVCSVIGFILLIALIFLVIYFCKRKTRRSQVEHGMASESQRKWGQPAGPVPPPVIKGGPPSVLAIPVPEKMVDNERSARRTLDSPILSPAPSYRSPSVMASSPATFVSNGSYDGVAVDPGKVYEYNTKTNERRWMTDGDGKAVMPSLPD